MQITYRRETKEGRGGAWKNTKRTKRRYCNNGKSIAVQYGSEKNYEIQCDSPNIKASRKLLEQARKR